MEISLSYILLLWHSGVGYRVLGDTHPLEIHVGVVGL